MHLRDLSLKTKLLVTNALMIIVPIAVLVAVGAALLGGLRHTGTLQQEALTLLWPEKGNALTVQFAMSSLRTESEKKKFKLDKIKDDIRLLEGAGVRLLVVQAGENYLTQGANPEELRRMVTRKCGARGAALTWDREGLFFRFEGLHSGTVIMGAGAVPMTGAAEEALIPHDMRELALNIILVLLISTASAGILLLGRYLARLLSEQILAPLAEMRAAAAAIRRAVRKELDIPILMVSARLEDVDKIRALGLGADDYIVKPFSPSELAARVKAHIARYERLKGGEQTAPTVLRFGDLEIQPWTHRVFVAGREVRLATREFELLLFLAEHPQIVFSKETLYDRVWDLDAMGSTSTISVHMNRLREKIEPDPARPRWLQTVWGAGYRFNNEA